MKLESLKGVAGEAVRLNKLKLKFEWPGVFTSFSK